MGIQSRSSAWEADDWVACTLAALFRPWDGDLTLLQLSLARRHRWLAMLDAGKAMTPADIARLEAMNIVQVREILRLTLLAPDIIEAIVDARAPRRLTLEFLLRRSIPWEWEEQRKLLPSAPVETP